MSIESNPIGNDDPRLTAYALGEMEGEERAAFEAHLLLDPAARAEVEGLRALAQQLESELAPAGDAQLDLAARSDVIATARAGRGGRGSWRVVRYAAAALLVVGFAGALIVATVPSIQEKSRNPSGTTFTALVEGQDEAGARGEGVLLDDWDRALGEDLESAPGQVKTDGAAPSTRPLPEPAPGSGGGASGQSAPATFEAPPVISVSGRPVGGVAPGQREPGDPQAPTVGLIGVGGGGGAPVPVQPGMDPRVAGHTLRYFERSRGGVRLRLDGKRGWGTEHYAHPGIDPFHRVTKRKGHTSTFSVDVDTASYANIRRMLRGGRLPPPAAVRVEELVNYFDYGYAAPAAGSEAPFRTHVQIATCPWEPKHRIARIAIKGREVDAEQRPAANLVFLVDVSGSMQGEDKLPLVKAGLERLAESIRDDDRVAIVTYAATASLRLGSTPGSEREAILAAIRALKAGGSTNGAGGIQMAYAEAQKGFRKEGVNRVILCTDGDFNVGVSDTNGLVRLISQKAKTGVYLSVLGYGTGNFQDGKMEALSNKGNGNYAYIDSQKESERVLIEEMQGTLVTIAKDVKFQLWFNPETVAGWRLLGYENRRLAARDFNDDSKDAGEVGAGHEVTALYEIIPTGAGVPGTVDPNPFVVQGGAKAAPTDEGPTPDKKALFIWRLRWKAPDGDTSKLVERNVFDKGLTFERADRDLQWASAVGAFGMLLRHSPHRGQASWDLVLELAAPAKGEDPSGRRAEFLELAKRAQGLMRGR